MSKKRTEGDNPLFFSETFSFLHIFLPKQMNKSPKTITSYSCGLNTFFDYIAEYKKISPMQFRFSDCTYGFVLDYMQYLQGQLNNSPSTVNARLAAIRSYLAYVSDGNIALTSIYLSIRRIETLTVPKPQRPIVEPDDLKVLLDIPKYTRIGNRDRFILILLYDAAVRVSELIEIRLGDISEYNTSYMILIHGKGRSERYIILSEKAAEHMKGYLAVYHKKNSDPKTPLLYTKIHDEIKPMSARNVERITAKYGKLAKEQCPNIPDRVHPHMFRRTRGTTMYRDGVPIEQVSALLGHKQIETTRTYYSRPSPEQIRESINKATVAEPECKEWLNGIDKMKMKFGLK